MAYGVVRTDNMAGTDVRGQLVSVEYMGSDGATPTAIENGNVLLLDGLKTGEREIYVGAATAVDSPLEKVVLVASPELMYDERKIALDEFINPAGYPARGYHIHPGDTFSVTADAITGSPAVGYAVELAAGTKLKAVASATEGSTQVGTVIQVDATGGYTYYVIKVG